MEGESIKGGKGGGLAFQDDVSAGQPVGGVGEDQVADDIYGAEGFGRFSTVEPGGRFPSQERVQDAGRLGQHFYGLIEMKFHCLETPCSHRAGYEEQCVERHHNVPPGRPLRSCKAGSHNSDGGQGQQNRYHVWIEVIPSVYAEFIILKRHELQSGTGKNEREHAHYRGDTSETRTEHLSRQVELGDFEVAGLGDLEVAGVALDDEDGDAGAFEERGFVGADELVGFGFGEGAAEERDLGTLRGLGVDDEFAGDGGGDEGAVGGALDLLDGVHRRSSYNRRPVFFDGVDGLVDGGGVDEGADGVMDQDDVVGRGGGQGGEGVGDGVLAGVAADDDVDLVLHAVLGDQGEDAGFFGGADGDVDRRDAREAEKRLERVLQDGQAAEGEELLGSGPGSGGHACTDTGGGENDEDGHGKLSIAREQTVEGRE